VNCDRQTDRDWTSPSLCGEGDGAPVPERNSVNKLTYLANCELCNRRGRWIHSQITSPGPARPGQNGPSWPLLYRQEPRTIDGVVCYCGDLAVMLRMRRTRGPTGRRVHKPSPTRMTWSSYSTIAETTFIYGLVKVSWQWHRSADHISLCPPQLVCFRNTAAIPDHDLFLVRQATELRWRFDIEHDVMSTYNSDAVADRAVKRVSYHLAISVSCGILAYYTSRPLTGWQ